ncbi:hypothetical protein JL108_14205 [Aeromicrobium sp. YIM 150415]|uniref:hypothetical protein n=1 Tax=Aeromicrobium sp. YIM 150415 TaxID=2803912 RepID=UPI001962E26C|nr:hypothetical protein [Aeromicrobium sp. YIM 150415]MBM9464606.1 hypothetical protein [Aeromicrobium sp. YIM 150415]
MNDELRAQATIVKAALHGRLRRFNLLFVQHGAVYDGLTDLILDAENSTVVRFENLRTNYDDTRVHVTGLERYALEHQAGPSLGELRSTVTELLERGIEVCLWSRAPRVAFAPVPGSSLIQDASPFFLELMSTVGNDPGSAYPAVRAGELLSDVYASALAELGVGVLASLDRALFDAQLDATTMFDILDAREIEALRGAGLVQYHEGTAYRLSTPLLFSELKAQLASTLSCQIRPQAELAAISEDLWAIERIIRRSLRSKAISDLGPKWRGSIFNQDLNERVLGRAQNDGSVAIKSVKGLRDPIEWLTLGELIDVVTSAKFANLEQPRIFWMKFKQDVVPVRNRLSHMRHFNHSDREVVRMWLSQVQRALG